MNALSNNYRLIETPTGYTHVLSKCTPWVGCFVTPVPRCGTLYRIGPSSLKSAKKLIERDRYLVLVASNDPNYKQLPSF